MTTPVFARPSDSALGNELAELRTLGFPVAVTAEHVHETIEELCLDLNFELIERNPGVQGVSGIYEIVLPPLQDDGDKYAHGFALTVMVTRPSMGAPVSLTMHSNHHASLPHPEATPLEPLNRYGLAALRREFWQPLVRLAESS